MRIDNIKSGFTFLELTLVITLFAIIFGATVISFGDIFKEKTLLSKRDGLVQDLRESRTNAISQKLNSNWGVYLDTVSDPDRYVVFKGGSYAGRDLSYDRIVEFPASVVFSDISLGGGQEVVFAKRTGQVSVSGSFRLIFGENAFTIYVNSFGVIDYSE